VRASFCIEERRPPMSATLEYSPLAPTTFPGPKMDPQQVVQTKTVLIGVTLRRLGVKRKVDPNTQHISTETDRRVLAIQKVLLVAPELEAIAHIDGQIRAYLGRVSLPDDILRRGWYLLATEMVDATDTQLADYQAERQEKVGLLKANYWTRIKEAEPRLKGMFNYADYPDVEELDAAFGMEIDYRETVAVPDTLKGVGNGLIWQRQGKKAVEQCQKIVADVEQGLIVYLEGFVSHLAARLGTQPDGKLMVFKDSSIERFREFVQNLPSMNITDNEQLNALGQQAQQLLEGISPELLRKNRTARELAKAELEELKAKVDPLIVPAKGRKFALKSHTLASD
jgi:hypothetical protein